LTAGPTAVKSEPVLAADIAVKTSPDMQADIASLPAASSERRAFSTVIMRLNDARPAVRRAPGGCHVLME